MRARTIVGYAISVLATASCASGGSPAPAPAPRAATPPATAAPVAPAASTVLDGSAPAPPDLTGAASIDAPTAPACAWDGTEWSGNVALRVAPAPAGATFARATQGRSARLATTGPTSGIFEVRGPLTVRGHVALADVALHPKHAFDVNGVVFADGRTNLSAQQLDGTNAKVSIVTKDDGLELVAPPPPLTMSCSDLVLDVKDIASSHRLPSGKPLRTTYLDAAKPVAITATVNGPTVARLVNGAAAENDVRVFAQQGGRARVAIDTGTMTVVGWVPVAALTDTPTRLAMQMQMLAVLGGGGAVPATGGAVPATGGAVPATGQVAPSSEVGLVCPHEVRLVALPSGGRRTIVGSFAATARVPIVKHDAELAGVHPDPGLEPVGDALYVPEHDLVSCTRAVTASAIGAELDIASSATWLPAEPPNAARVLAGLRGRFRACMMKSLVTAPPSARELHLAIAVTKVGEVESAKVTSRANEISAAAGECIAKVMTRAQFDATGAETKADVKLTVTARPH